MGKNDPIQLGIHALALSELVSSPFNPRSVFVESELQELAESMKKAGNIVPLIVRASEGAWPCYEIIDGERRFRAAKILGFKELICDVVHMNDDEVRQTQIVANLQRANVHPLDEAKGFKALIDSMKVGSVQLVADRLGKPVGFVAKRLKLLDLVPELQKALQEEKIGVGHAQMLAKLEPKHQKDMLKDGLFEGWDNEKQAVTTEKLAELIKEQYFLQLKGAPFDVKDATLVSKAGACTVCPYRSGAHPGLFDDLIAKGDLCTKFECFAGKVDAHIHRTVMQAEAEGKTLHCISSSYSRPRLLAGKKVIASADFTTYGNKKDLTSLGIYVDGENMGKIVPIALRGAAKEKAKADKTESGLSKAERSKREKRKLEIWNNKIEQEVRLRTTRAIMEKFTFPMDRKDLELVVLALADKHMRGSEAERICALNHIDLPKNAGSYGFNMSDHLAKRIGGLTGAQVVGLALTLAIDKEQIQDPSFINEEEVMFKELCTRYLIDRSAITEQVRGEWEPKKPKVKPMEEKPSRAEKSAQRFAETGKPPKAKSTKSKK